MKLNRRSFFSGSLALGMAVFAGESHAFPGTHVDQDTENLEGDMLNPAYFDQFPHLASGRLENGVVLARLHTKEEESMLTLNAYDELREAFTKISLDPANQGLGAYRHRNALYQRRGHADVRRSPFGCSMADRCGQGAPLRTELH
jgi:hypothetical protein